METPDSSWNIGSGNLIAGEEQMVRDENGRFIKGVSGNPNGRPKKERELRYYEIMQTTCTFVEFKAICQKAVDQAKRGDAVARKWLADYLIGAPAQKHELSGIDGGELVINLSWGDSDAKDDD